MSQFRIALIAVGIALGTLVPATGHTADVPSLPEQAQQAASKGNISQALGIFELALTQAAGQPDSVYVPLATQYSQWLEKTNDYPRALSFFTAQVAEQDSPSATLLAYQANAIGRYFGWLEQNGLMSSVTPDTLKTMDAKARSAYNRALTLDPNNFHALFGFAIYESYSPNGRTHMQQLLTKLDTLRAAHPQYPWQIVDNFEKQGHL